MVSSDQRRRQLAREKYVRQQQRREEKRRKDRRRNTVVAAVLAVVLASGGAVYASVALSDGSKKGSDNAAGDTPTTPAPSPSEEESENPEPKLTVDQKASYDMALKTNAGDITIAMDASKTPRTVNSFKHLADKKYFDGSKCHRLTTQNIYVLQCGDPQGTGTGGPGYTIPDENLDALGKAGSDGSVTFPAGTVAMANTGQPGTGGSQFFLVYKDTKLPPTYTPFGKIDAAGLKAVQEVAAAGVEGGAGDGAPKKAVTIEKATVTKK
ncbi:peptidyl-prolyl cis-trans isomerase [Streptomyces cinereoruber]|uniref:Peptidyl-prolyl cis-trans isomerase n=1 Tax=Streptomyces cinereoruber TaxID=67260 RepID=A0AAV4KIW4_9ACTN|nr:MULTISPECIES: peptidylprolyl isomerase [Streptomyces]AVH98410.1 peptidylprolyl isomerase [Streptomyces sp. WAC00288]KYG52673.1 peptidylprolyl isomerase [Streptomyces sp. WAC04657]MBB4159441.1 peptidyl-prolyl cis-trans isomerase B (cyclophilin B) [Streptomyces cinereoruber]MBY8817405.1 peptidylprolyl isomerase [Streptomyces cinereoruber]NIH64099.1 peptidyl-prolyl cis-trans isomerase B (cyclophilin B) [Streptomyces cinereoruber]